VPNRDHTVVNDGTGVGNSTNVYGCELGREALITNYARKTTTITSAVDNANDRVNVAISSVSFAALGGAHNQTVRRAVLYKDLGGADTANVLIACFDIDGPGGTGLLTNGGDLDLDTNELASGGNLRIASA
jgi:hypothetical protein